MKRYLGAESSSLYDALTSSDDHSVKSEKPLPSGRGDFMSNTSISSRPDDRQEKIVSFSRNNNGQNDRPKRSPSTTRWSDRSTFEEGVVRPRGASIIAELCELDRDLIHLIVRRTRLLGKLPIRQAGSGNADNERELRLSWEKNATEVSRDPRFIRQLFALLRELEVVPSDMDHVSVFNLAPVQKPLDMDLVAPMSDWRIRAAVALAAASGSCAEFSGVPLSSALISCLKMLNQVGASLRWEEDGQIFCRDASPMAGVQAGKLGSVLDKAIHIGDNIFNLYLLLFLMTTRPTRLKIIGEGDLNLTDIAPLRHFLPKLGARLTAVIPGRDGLPARLETSALLPTDIDLSDDLPREAVLALCLSAAFYPSPMTIRGKEYPDVESIFNEAYIILSSGGIHVERTSTVLHVIPGRVVFKDNLIMGLHLPAVATLLAMPAFVGGTARLSKVSDLETNKKELTAREIIQRMLEEAGLKIKIDGETIQSSPDTEKKDQIIHFASLSPDIFPIGLALALIPIIRHGKKKLPKIPENIDQSMVDDFLCQIGITRKDGEEVEIGTVEDEMTPWTAPSPSWAMAFSLVAFLHPHIKLINPNIITSQIPDFWNIYNTLPTPVLHSKIVEIPQEPVRPQRRRVFANYMPESERPEPLPTDEDD